MSSKRHAVHRRSPRTASPTGLLSILAISAAATRGALAVDLPPGGAVALPGTTPTGGVVIRDALIPFEVRDGTVTLFAGIVQDRVFRRADGMLTFSRRIRDTLVDTPEGVVEVQVSSYTGVDSDVDWSPTSAGTDFPTLATRSGDGSEIAYDFSSNPIFETEESKFFYVETDVDDFTVNGSMTIRVESGHSTTFTIAQPFQDDTPPIAEIISPTPLSCACNPVAITGIAYDPDGTYQSDLAEYRPIAGGPWSLIGQSFSETPPPGGLLYTWNTSFVSQGYYFLRLSVFNTEGLDAEETTIIWVDKQFDGLVYNALPAVVGGVVCPNGTINDHCAEEFSIAYAPEGGFFQPIDPGMPVYPGPKINQTFAPWDTVAGAIPDGVYRLRVTAFDDCGHTAQQEHETIVDNTPPTAVIDSPFVCECVDGVVEVIGTAHDANLAGWSLQYTGGEQNGWVTINSGSDPVIGGLLGEWDTTNLPDCPHTLRLVVTDAAVIDCNGAIHHRTEFTVAVDVGCTCTEDIDGSGDIGFGDLLAIISGWGPCP